MLNQKMITGPCCPTGLYCSLFDAYSPTVVKINITDAATNFTDGDLFHVKHRGSNSGSTISKAGIWVTLYPITKGVIHYSLSSYFQDNVSANSYDMFRQLVDIDSFSNPEVFFLIDGKESAGSTTSISIVDFGTNDSDRSVVSGTVAGSVLTGMSESEYSLLISGPLSITSGNRYGVAGSIGQGNIRNCTLVVKFE